MDNEVRTVDTPKVRPFNVMDQMVAHRLAVEGFEILSVIPSDKYAAEAHFMLSCGALRITALTGKRILHTLKILSCPLSECMSKLFQMACLPGKSV